MVGDPPISLPFSFNILLYFPSPALAQIISHLVINVVWPVTLVCFYMTKYQYSNEQRSQVLKQRCATKLNLSKNVLLHSKAINIMPFSFLVTFCMYISLSFVPSVYKILYLCPKFRFNGVTKKLTSVSGVGRPTLDYCECWSWQKAMCIYIQIFAHAHSLRTM